jgi:hypothetical protein
MVLLQLKYEADCLGNNIGRTTVPGTQMGIGEALPRERLSPLADKGRLLANVALTIQ